WHPTKNGNLTPDQIEAGTKKKVWRQCSNDPTHEWEPRPGSRIRNTGGTDRPISNRRWTGRTSGAFVTCLKGDRQTCTPAELYLLFQQNGLLHTEGKSKAFVKALATGRFPKEEIAKFVNGEPSLVDQFVQDPTKTLEALGTNEPKPDDVKDDALDR